MSVILILILASLAMALLFLGAFIWAVRSGQFEDTLTPSMRVLAEDVRAKAPDAEEKSPNAGGIASPPSAPNSGTQQGANH